MKKLIIILTFIGLSFTTVLGYATIQYIKHKEINEQVSVGSTIEEVDGINVWVVDKEQGTLTYSSVNETDTNKHELTYEYGYEILIPNSYVEVSSVSNDIEIVDVEYGDTVSITFRLNEDSDVDEGDVLDVRFVFEVKEFKDISEYTRSEPFDLNNATYYELIGAGFYEEHAQLIIDERELNGGYNSIFDLDNRIGSDCYAGLYIDYENNGYLIFGVIN